MATTTATPHFPKSLKSIIKPRPNSAQTVTTTVEEKRKMSNHNRKPAKTHKNVTFSLGDNIVHMCDSRTIQDIDVNLIKKQMARNASCFDYKEEDLYDDYDSDVIYEIDDADDIIIETLDDAELNEDIAPLYDTSSQST